jgi:hypothetical protein
MVVLAGATAPVARVLEFAKLGETLPISQSLEDALAHTSSPPTARVGASRARARPQSLGGHEGDNLRSANI